MSPLCRKLLADAIRLFPCAGQRTEHRRTELKHPEHDEKPAEKYGQHAAIEIHREQRRKHARRRCRQRDGEQIFGFYQPVFGMNGYADRGHGYERYEIDRLSRMLVEAAERRKKRNEQRSSAHSHAAYYAAGQPCKKQRHEKNAILTPAIIMSAANITAVTLPFIIFSSADPRAPPATTPKITGRFAFMANRPLDQ